MAKKTWHMIQLTFSSNVYWKIVLKFCILEQIIATVLFICISSINNKRSLLRFQSTTAPTNRGWSACGQMKREYHTTLGDADSANYITLSYPAQSFTWCSLENVSYEQERNVNCSTAPKTALGAHWFQITVTCDRELWVGPGKKTKQNN